LLSGGNNLDEEVSKQKLDCQIYTRSIVEFLLELCYCICVYSVQIRLAPGTWQHSQERYWWWQARTQTHRVQQ